MASQKSEFQLSSVHSFADGYASVSRCRRCGIVIGFGDRCEYCIEHPSGHDDAPGDYFGRHHSEWTTTVDELLIQGDDDQAEFLLWKLIDATEIEAKVAHAPPFERHFTRLIQLARRRGDERLARETRDRYVACVTTAADQKHEDSGHSRAV